MSLPHLLFVYGSLKRGYWNNPILCDAEFRGAASTVDRFALTKASGAGFPFMLESPQRHNVEGELYGIDDPTLAMCDRLEGHPDFYHRKQIAVRVGDGAPVEAWCYFLNPRDIPDRQMARLRDAIFPEGRWPRGAGGH